MTEASHQTPPQLCGECGCRHYPGENTLCPGWRPGPFITDEVHPAVAAEMATACDDNPTGKKAEHFATRNKLFAEVDRQIRARVRVILPEVTLEFKQQIDRDLGLDALRQRVDTLAAGIGKTADKVSADAAALSDQFETLLDQRIKQLLTEASDQVIAAFEQRVERLVAHVVGKQIGALLAPKIRAARLVPSEYRVRVKKKRKRA